MGTLPTIGGSNPFEPQNSLNLGSVLSPQLPNQFTLPTFPLNTAPVDNLNKDIENLRTQLKQLKAEVAGKSELAALNKQLETITLSIESVTEKGQELKAKVILPPQEYMNVQLVPSHSFERLEEYRADEKKAYVLLGVFLGGVLGILSNWATQETYAMTKAAGILVVLFGILTVGLILWAWQISRRVTNIKAKMFNSPWNEGTNASVKNDEQPKVSKTPSSTEANNSA